MPILIAVDGSGWSGFIRIYWASQAVFEDNRPAGPVKRQKYPFLPLLLSNEKLPKYIFLRIAGISARNICCGGITLTLYACHMDCIGVSINSQNEPHRIVQVAWWNEYAGNCPFACRGDYAVWLSLEQLFHCIVCCCSPAEQQPCKKDGTSPQVPTFLDFTAFLFCLDGGHTDLGPGQGLLQACGGWCGEKRVVVCFPRTFCHD